MRPVIVVSLLAATTLWAACAAVAQQMVPNRDMELRVGSTTFLGETRLGKIYSGTKLTRAIYDANTLVVKRGESLLFSAYLVAGATPSDVTRDANLHVTALQGGCIQITAGSIVAAPSPRCSEIIDAAGDMVSSFGVTYSDSAHQVYGYDVFTIKITK